MTVPNIGPELPDPHDCAYADGRKGNPSFVYRDELVGLDPAGDPRRRR